MLPCSLPDPALIVFDKVTIAETNSVIRCQAFVTQQTAVYPRCQASTSRIHSKYQRKLADLPWAGKPVQIWLQVRRFFCQNVACRRKIFNERLPTVAAPWARRTKRLAETQQVIGLMAGGSDGSRLCTALGMNASIDLLLDLVWDTLCKYVKVSPRIMRPLGAAGH